MTGLGPLNSSPVAAAKIKRLVALVLFIVIGLFETIVAYFLFSRADDHKYFLELANTGLAALPDHGQDMLDLKARAAGLIFYFITSPSRWSGGGELVHLLWLRVVSLVGALCAFRWFNIKLAPGAKFVDRQRAESRFMLLMLLYPGQIAWTASLLRDGVALALFFVGLTFLRKGLIVFLALVFLGAAFALRPEYVIILISLMVAFSLHGWLRRVKSKGWLLLILLLSFSIATHEIQAKSAAFGQLAFGDGGFAYPSVAGWSDLPGYFRIFLQALIDPISLSAPVANAFGVIESLFFIYILSKSYDLMRHPSTRVAAVTMALLFGMWIFAYFEIFVSGFSRHRMCLEIALMAVISVIPLVSNRDGLRSVVASR